MTATQHSNKDKSGLTVQICNQLLRKLRQGVCTFKDPLSCRMSSRSAWANYLNWAESKNAETELGCSSVVQSLPGCSACLDTVFAWCSAFLGAVVTCVQCLPVCSVYLGAMFSWCSACLGAMLA